MRLHPNRSQHSQGPTNPGTEESRQFEEETIPVLLNRIALGDEMAFWKLWETYRQHLYNVCTRLMGGVPEDAEDALSTAMLKAREMLPQYAGQLNNVKAWLTRLTYNLCMDIHRKGRQTKYFKSIDDETFSADDEPLAHESPEEIMLRRERYAFVYSIIECLPARLRLVFEQRFLQDLSYSVIATRMDITTANARKRSQQSRAIVRTALQKYLNGDVPHAPVSAEQAVDSQPGETATGKQTAPVRQEGRCSARQGSRARECAK
jgi:RNA polymerase sigma factor (sigma-70 family)